MQTARVDLGADEPFTLGARLRRHAGQAVGDRAALRATPTSTTSSALRARLAGLRRAARAAAAHAGVPTATLARRCWTRTTCAPTCSRHPRTRRSPARSSPASPRRGARRSRAGDPDNTYFGSYREVFARDLYEAWTGLLADGDLATARDTVGSCSNASSCPTGRCRATACVNGKLAPDSFGTQLDEVAYPILMACQLGHDRRGAVHAITSGRRRTSSSRTGPAFGSERWEEQSGYSPSTIAAEIAGLHRRRAEIADAQR